MNLLFRKSLIMSLKQTSQYCFSSAGGHHEVAESHHPTVQLNKTQNWLDKPDEKNEPFAILGFKDVNDHHHEDHTDPFSHLRNVPFFSIRRWYFSDPYYHEEDHEPLWNLPHGYLTYDDPLDNRNLLDRPGVEVFGITLVMGFLILFFGYASLHFTPLGKLLMQENITADMLEEEIRKIRRENKALVDRRDALKAKIAK